MPVRDDAVDVAEPRPQPNQSLADWVLLFQLIRVLNDQVSVHRRSGTDEQPQKYEDPRKVFGPTQGVHSESPRQAGGEGGPVVETAKQIAGPGPVIEDDSGSRTGFSTDD